MQAHILYSGLRDVTRTVIDTSIEGALMKKTTDQAYEILEDTTTNSNQWPKDRLTPGKAMGRLDNEVLNNLVNQVAQLTKQQGTINSVQSNPWELCKFCGGQHSSAECHSRQQTIEHAQYVSRFNQPQQ